MDVREDRARDEPAEVRGGERWPAPRAAAPAGGSVSTREAATLLGISERTIRRAILDGKLAATKDGWSYRIDREALGRFAPPPREPDAPRPLARVVPFPGHDLAYLPAPLSSFVGREAEVAAVIAELHDPRTRLLTLTGAGGTGKTRLALAAAAAVSATFPDGVAFVPLADVRDPRMMVPAICNVLGIRARPGQDHATQLRTVLRHKRMLLVLDNFEQLLASGPEVANLLTEAPGLKALVTSRAPLRVAGEHERRVAPMTMAGPGATPLDLLASDAGRLFVERAREHDPSFTMDDESAPLVADICARLDGLPLAVELAAAMTNLLPLRQLLARLEPRLPLLTRGPRDAPARHGTMRDAIAWSYGLLSAPQQWLFRQLAVFSGGATLEAATGVLGIADHASDSLSAIDAIDAIGELVEHNLLTVASGLDGERRFRMLETIREFGVEQLAAAGEEDEARVRHARHFLALSRNLRPLISTHSSSPPFDILTAEYANLLGALEWLHVHGPAADFVELVADVCEFWYTSSFGRDAALWIERAAARFDDAAPLDQARLQVGRAAVLVEQGDFAQAQPLLVSGLSLLRTGVDDLYISRALVLVGGTLGMQGESAAAEEQMREALVLAEGLADPVLRAAAVWRALTNLCVAARGQREFARAAAYGEAALRLCEDEMFRRAKASSLLDLGSLAFDTGEYEPALTYLLASISSWGERGDMRQVADAVSLLACIAVEWKAMRDAALLFGAAEAVRERVGAAMLWTSDIAAVERSLAIVRESSGEQALAEWSAAGRALLLSDAVAIAGALTCPAPAGSATGRAVDALTLRERDVLQLLAEHRTDREIAEALYLSPRTVNWHVGSILSKLGAASRREAIVKARAAGLP